VSAGSRIGGLTPAVAAAAGCAALGATAFVGLSATMHGDLVGAVVAGALCAALLSGAIAVGWIDPMGPLVASLALPALYADDDVRVSAALVAAVVVVAGWALGRGLDRRPLAAHPGAARSFTWLVAAMLVAALFADARVPAVRESVNFVVLLGVFLFALERVDRSPEQAHVFVRWATIGGALAGVAAGLETIGALPGRFPLAGTGLSRAAGGFGWPNELAMYLTISLPLALCTMRTTRGAAARLAAAAAVGAIALGLAATFSRGSWVAAAAAPAVLVLVGETKLALRFWGATLLVGVVIDVSSGGAVSARIGATSGDALVAQRLLLTGAGLLMFQSSPLFGVGPGGFGDALEAFGPQISGLFDFVGSAHNGYVHIAAEAGVLGLLAFVSFVATTLLVLARSARAARGAGDAQNRERALRVALLWSFTAASIVTLFEWPFGHGVAELIVLVAATGRVLAARGPTGSGNP
jgi:O-antigen ligase